MKVSLGPGALIAAAFIGPGTVTTCTLAGANFGFALVWALVFATFATIVLQEMSARLGAGAGLGLGEALMKTLGPVWLRVAAGGLVFAAIVIGNAAYEAGNLSGGAIGLSTVFEAPVDDRAYVLAMSATVAAALWRGQYRVLETVLLVLVLAMAVTFVLAAALSQPDFGALARGFVPSLPKDGGLTAIALIGTTIVPYNLFLHAAAAKRRWPGGNGVGAARTDAVISIGLGGLISILIVTTAASALFANGIQVANAADMAKSVEPVAGPAARYLVGFGLFAAGLTSAIAAPLATGYALSEILPIETAERRSLVFRATALAVLAIGAAIASLGLKPLSVIVLAQASNGLLLPIIATFLLVVMNRKSLLGDHANGLASNGLGALVTVIALALGARALGRAFGVWP
ncbi:MAG: Nramp family divalent metal transporter [Pseudomonadota bacterium]